MSNQDKRRDRTMFGDVIAAVSRRTVLAAALGMASTMAILPAAMAADAYDQYYAKAQDEGELLIYTVAPPAYIDELAGKFMERFPGVNVRTFSATNSPLMERFMADAARKSVQSDILLLSDVTTVDEIIKQDLALEFTPESAAVYPANYSSFAPYAWPDRMSDFVVVYNVDLVSDEDAALLKTWDGVANARWADKIAVSDPSLVGAWKAGWYMLWKMNGDDWLARIGDLHPVIYDSNVPAVESVVTGQNHIAMATGASTAAAYARGAPIHVVWPEPTPLSIGQALIPKNAPHENAAKLFQEWLHSAEGQLAWATAYSILVPHPDVPDVRPYNKEPWFTGPITTYPLDAKAFIAEGDEGIAAWDRAMKK